VGDLLADGYAYKTASGWITGDDLKETSLTGTVEVKPVPVKITQQPQSQTITYGDPVTLSVAAQAADSAKPITYQWFDKDGDKISGATAADYTPAGLAAGTYSYSCAVTCDGYTVNSDSVTVTVNKAPLTITGAALETRDYDPDNLSAVVTGVTFDKAALALDTDYTASAVYDDANAGENKSAVVTVTLAETVINYTLPDRTYTASGTITPRAVTPTVSTEKDSYEYTGAAIEPPVTVTDKNGGTIDPKEYKVTYADNIEKGAAKVTVSDAEGGNYQIVTAEVDFKITGRQLANAVVKVEGAPFTYDGTAQTPAVTVTHQSGDVVGADEYTVSYEDNQYAGTAKVIVTSTNKNYEGSNSAGFEKQIYVVVAPTWFTTRLPERVKVLFGYFFFQEKVTMLVGTAPAEGIGSPWRKRSCPAFLCPW